MTGTLSTISTSPARVEADIAAHPATVLVGLGVLALVAVVLAVVAVKLVRELRADRRYAAEWDRDVAASIDWDRHVASTIGMNR